MFDGGRAAGLGIVLVAAAFAGCAGTGPSDAEHARSIAREAADGLTTPDAAKAAGYEPDPFCAPDEGVHWIDHDRVDGELDPTDPEALVFLPTTDDIESTAPGDQRFLGVEYIQAVEDADAEAPSLMGVPMKGPMPGHTPEMPRHAELHVYQADEADASDTFASSVAGIDCPASTTPPGVQDEGNGDTQRAQTEPASCSETLDGQRTHDHARIELYLDSERPFDLSPERYQLADRSIHFEAGDRDAGGAIVHLHEGGATMGCMLEALGWNVDHDRLILDDGTTYQTTDDTPFEVFVDGSRSPDGFDTRLEHGRTYVLRYNSTAAVSPCPDVGGTAVHEHAELDVRLNSSEPWDFSPSRYQDQSSAVRLEDGSADADGARIHVHEDRPSLGCLFATLGWETHEQRIETDTGDIYEAANGTEIEVLADGEPLQEGFDAPIQQARTYEIRYNATPANASAE
ncbi:hypothetical protein BRD56_05230 [Thermoplasmatales archaeon SW_10_69_26]|nr:MAG: hypothetical protein BRD56_05230 [Thermoplasmatales archaeon SW_10_69_26]